MYKSLLEKDLKQAVQSLGFKNPGDIVISISKNPKLGDYSSNVALQLSKQKSSNSYHSPIDVANAIIQKLGHPEYLETVEVAGPGFINFFLKDKSLIKCLDSRLKTQDSRHSKRTLIEYASPNAFKPLHIGHFRNITTGEAISRLLEYSGDQIFRVTYTSDIGPAVAKALWGVLKFKDEFNQIKEKGTLSEKIDFLGKAYVEGNRAFEEDEEAQREIDQINLKIYAKDPNLLPLWKLTRDWSQAYLSSIYLRLGTKFNAEVWESEVGELGKQIVKENLGSVFKEDQGSVILPKEKSGLHTRVFLNSAGNPTYEAKELGVTIREEELFPFDRAIHVVANEQTDYFKVVIKAVEMINPQMLGRKIHLPFGFVTLSTGKMSSRKGNIISAEELLEKLKEKILKDYGGDRKPSDLAKAEKIAIAAAKFYMLKYSLNSDIVFDLEGSISLQGDTGPYLLYAFARIFSLLQKGQSGSIKGEGEAEFNEEERNILRQLEYFELNAEQAAKKFQPNELGIYLLNLAKAFNLFYEKYQVLGVKEESFRLALSARVADTLKYGLYLLGIETLNKM